VVGTGSLLLPKAFSETGWLLSSVLIVFLAFTSFLTVTFVVEALSCSNAVIKWRRLQYMKREMVRLYPMIHRDVMCNVIIFFFVARN